MAIASKTADQGLWDSPRRTGPPLTSAIPFGRRSEIDAFSIHHQQPPHFQM
jgi:hypothetical protein